MKRNILIVIIMIGTVFAAAMLLSGCQTDKTYAGAGTISALKIESSGSAATGTATPNLLIGGATYAGVGAPATENRPVYIDARRSSLIDKIFGLGVSDAATIYIGIKDETAEQTATRLKALKTESSAATGSVEK